MLRPFSKFAVLALVGLALAGCQSSAEEREQIIWGAPIASTSAMVEPAAFAAEPVSVDAAQRLTKPYFIDFRSRAAMSYGHTFVVYGELDRNGNIPEDSNGVLIHSMTEVAGLHPASTSNIPYTLGHLVPVPSETGPSDGDTERRYMTAHYRIDLTPAEYQDVVQYIHGLQASSPVWHAVLYNCSAFVGDIAKHMGLKTPNPLLFPKNYITELKEMNS